MGYTGYFRQNSCLFPQCIAEVETPMSEGNCSATAAKCHRHTKMLIYVTQRKHGKQAPGSSVLFHFFSFTFFLGSVTRNDTEPAWRVELNVCGKTVNFKADSGVDLTVLSEKAFTPFTAEPAVATPNIPWGCINTNGKSFNFNTCAREALDWHFPSICTSLMKRMREKK